RSAWRGGRSLESSCAVVAVERDHVVAASVQPLAAGQAPCPPHCLVAGAADPEPGRVLAAVDAQLDSVRRLARRDHPAPPGHRRRRSGQVLAGRQTRGCCYVLHEPSGEAIAAWPAGRRRLLALGLPLRIGAAPDAVIAQAMRALTGRRAARTQV